MPLLPPDLTTTYERSGGLRTGRYEEVLRFGRALARAKPDRVRFFRYGTTPEGRPMMALLLGSGRRKPLIFVQNGIHPGEIEGKDASLLLARRIAFGEEPSLARADWLIVPVYSVDGHERFGPYHRINQNGPVEMGWRATAQNLNLNRDWVKADAPETRPQITLIRRFDPDFLFDCHTTDGADYRYDVMLGVPWGSAISPALATFGRRLYDAVVRANEGGGFLTAPYFELNDRSDPGKGLTVQDFGARYSHGYWAQTGRAGMLIETHMLKPYARRVEATERTIRSTVEWLFDHPAPARERLAEGANVALASRMTDERTPFLFRGWRHAPRPSEIAGEPVAAWAHEAVDFPTFVRWNHAREATIRLPAAYVVPAAWTEAISRAEIHGLGGFRLARAAPVTGEAARFSGVTWGAPFEGRTMPRYRSAPESYSGEVAPGSLVVPASRLAAQLLEPASPDSLVRWGFFNAVFEQKEYGEDYAVAPLAERWARERPDLRAEFDRDVAAGAVKGARERLDWWFRRSPYWDRAYLRYPVVRIGGAELRRLRGAARRSEPSAGPIRSPAR